MLEVLVKERCVEADTLSTNVDRYKEWISIGHNVNISGIDGFKFKCY